MYKRQRPLRVPGKGEKGKIRINGGMITATEAILQTACIHCIATVSYTHLMAWAKEQARIETEKFEQEKTNHCIPITFHPNRKIAHGEKRKFQGDVYKRQLFLFSQMYQTTFQTAWKANSMSRQTGKNGSGS